MNLLKVGEGVGEGEVRGVGAVCESARAVAQKKPTNERETVKTTTTTRTDKTRLQSHNNKREKEKINKTDPNTRRTKLQSKGEGEGEGEAKRKQSQRNLVAKRISGPGPRATTPTTPTTPTPPRHQRSYDLRDTPAVSFVDLCSVWNATRA